MRHIFLHLIRLGAGVSSAAILPDYVDWQGLLVLAEQQGLVGVALDGIDKLPLDQRPKKQDILRWIGVTLQYETQNAVQQKAASEMAAIFHKNTIRTYVLKGEVVAECYPNPLHRFSVDLDCFLLPDDSDFDAWSFGNELIKAQGYEVNFEYYKNSTFFLPGLTVENHQYMVPFRGNKKLTKLEILLQSYMRKDKGEDRIEGTYLYRPPVMTALFLVEHAYSHFLHEGLTWRMVLDWTLYTRRHESELEWDSLERLIDEFGLRKFYNAFYRLGKYLVGEIQDFALNSCERKMLEDVWAELDVHETVNGIKGKLALVGNTWRARWKYNTFAEISWIQALWIQVKGFIFIRKTSL